MNLGAGAGPGLFDGRPVTQSEFDEFISRQTSFDPDIWVLDIDDPDGHRIDRSREHFVTAYVRFWHHNSLLLAVY